MLKNIYSIFDKKAAFYLTPFFLRNDPEAQRAVQQMLQTRDNQLALSPQDYQLVRIGTYDDTTSEIIPTETVVICEVVALAPNEPLQPERITAELPDPDYALDN